MISTQTISERSLLPPVETLCNRSWPDKVTVDISLLLKPKDDEEPVPALASNSTTGSPSSVSRSVATPVSVSGPGDQLPRSTPTTIASTIPAKRSSRPFDHPVSESPAKKQSKWSPEEDAKIIQLRGEGMKWEDISKHLPGRSAISCRLHYQNYLERRSEWDEDRKNKLARLYERFKADMWARIAEEMAIPWRAAEAMHWQMGEQEMARRAGVTPFSLTTNSQNQQGPITSGPRAHTRSNSGNQRTRRDSAPQNIVLPPQLPSLAELTAGIPAYSPHPHHSHSHSHSQSLQHFPTTLTPSHMHNQSNGHHIVQHNYQPPQPRQQAPLQHAPLATSAPPQRL